MIRGIDFPASQLRLDYDDGGGVGSMSVLTDQMRAAIREELAKYPDKQAATLPALHITQDALRHVPLEAIREIAEMLDLHPAQVHDTMSFYGFFRDEKQPLGKHRVWVCRSLSCMLCGGETCWPNCAVGWACSPAERRLTASSPWSPPNAWECAKAAPACWWTTSATET